MPLQAQRSHQRATDITTDSMRLPALRIAGASLGSGTVQRAAVIAASLVALAGAVVLVWAPPWIGLAVAIGSAVAWCAWLDGHPESADDADRDE
jgi:hypothetical protein